MTHSSVFLKTSFAALLLMICSSAHAQYEQYVAPKQTEPLTTRERIERGQFDSLMEISTTARDAMETRSVHGTWAADSFGLISLRSAMTATIALDTIVDRSAQERELAKVLQTEFGPRSALDAATHINLFGVSEILKDYLLARQKIYQLSDVAAREKLMRLNQRFGRELNARNVFSGSGGTASSLFGLKSDMAEYLLGFNKVARKTLPLALRCEAIFL